MLVKVDVDVWRSTCSMATAFGTSVLVALGVCSVFPTIYARNLQEDGVRHMIKRDITPASSNDTSTPDYNVSDNTSSWRQQLMTEFMETHWYKERNIMQPAFCFDERKINHKYSGNFFCPDGNETHGIAKCCGPVNQQYCCDSVSAHDGESSNELLVTIIPIVGAVIVCITICLLLYCCCGKNSDMDSRKFVWIRKSEKPEKGNQDGTELEGFTEKKDGVSTENGNTTGLTLPTKTHIAASGQTMAVPLINIQASTPDQ